MAQKMRLTQEEEVVNILKKEGFREVLPAEFQKEPYKSMLILPDCFNLSSKQIHLKDAKI